MFEWLSRLFTKDKYNRRKKQVEPQYEDEEDEDEIIEIEYEVK